MAEATSSKSAGTRTATESGRTVSSDQLTATELQTNPVLPTTKDALGTERIVGVRVDPWTPRQVQPTTEQKKAAEQREKDQQAARDARLALLQGTG